MAHLLAPNCNGTQYKAGTKVTLTANSGSAYQFKSWTGSTFSTVNPLTLTMTANRSASAPPPVPSDSQTGTITLTPSQTASPTNTLVPTPAYALIRSSSGGGANVRSEPGGGTRATRYFDHAYTVAVDPATVERSSRELLSPRRRRPSRSVSCQVRPARSR